MPACLPVSQKHASAFVVMFKGFLSRFKTKSVPLIVVGTDYLSYQLAASLQQHSRYLVKFFINEDPWHHRTTMLGAELRYENELLALVRRHGIKVVCCALESDFLYYQSHYAEALCQLHCQLRCCDGSTDLTSLVRAC